MEIRGLAARVSSLGRDLPFKMETITYLSLENIARWPLSMRWRGKNMS
jgi:hypothetical protein